MVEIPHLDKKVWLIVIGGAILIGLYLRHRQASVSTDGTQPSDTLSGTSDLPNIEGDGSNPYGGGSYSVDGSGGTVGPQGVPGPRGPRGKPGRDRRRHRNHHPGKLPTRTIRHGNNAVVKGAVV